MFPDACASYHRRMTCRPVLTLLVALPLGLAGAVYALDNLDLRIERVAGAGWSAEAISVQLDLPQPQGIAAHALVARLQLAGQKEPMRDVRIDCIDVQLSEQTVICPHARITA